MGVYDFTVKTSQGKEKSLADYKGKVLVIVNTASKCGFTPQFKGLQDLYMKYKGKGLEILGFPCNQFAEQDPEGNSVIEQFCRFNYGVTFQIFEKGDVRGETAQPLFKFLTKEKGFEGFDMNHSDWLRAMRTLSVRATPVFSVPTSGHVTIYIGAAPPGYIVMSANRRL